MIVATPGPGTYVAPSAFGIYVGEKALNASFAQRERSLSKTKSPKAQTSRSYGGDTGILLNKAEQKKVERKRDLSTGHAHRTANILRRAQADNQPIFYTGLNNPGGVRGGSASDLTKNLTAMEKKLLRKLKESARGKPLTQPIMTN